MDYRGNIGMIIINQGKRPFIIKAGERLGQAVLCKYNRINWILVDDLSELSPTERGSNGYGHTGTN